MSREYTVEETRKEFLKNVVQLVNYWEGDLDKSIKSKSSREKLEGLAFSMLVMLDGGSGSSPGFIVAPSTDESDKDYHKEQGENWYPQNHNSNIKCDIGGFLHELICKHLKEVKND